MSEKLLKIADELSSLTLIEASELSKILEEKWGVSATAPVAAVAASPAASSAPAAVEKTEFDVVLKASGDKKVSIIKIVREKTGLGLKEAKDLVDSAPKVVKEGLKKDEAEALKKALEAEGATVELK